MAVDQISLVLPDFPLQIICGELEGLDKTGMPVSTLTLPSGTPVAIACKMLVGDRMLDMPGLYMVGTFPTGGGTGSTGTRASAVRSLFAQVNSNRSLTIGFVAPADLGSPASSEYVIRVFLANGSASPSTPDVRVQPGTAYTTPVLDAGTWTVQVAAISAERVGVSASVNVVIAATASGVGLQIDPGTLMPSGPITITQSSTNKTVQGRLFSAAGQTHITVEQGVTGAVITNNRSLDADGIAINNLGANTQITYNEVGGNNVTGIRTRFGGAGTFVAFNKLTGSFNDVPSGRGDGMAIAHQYCDGGTIACNLIEDSYGYTADILSCYSSNNTRMVGNVVRRSTIQHFDAAPMTVGDFDAQDQNALPRGPGGNNYMAGNYFAPDIVGGRAPGVFGSTGNTVLEYNCFGTGIQAYNYSGTFLGVTVRLNAINFANVYTRPDEDTILEWGTNVDGSTPAAVPGRGLGYFEPDGVTFNATPIPA